MGSMLVWILVVGGFNSDYNPVPTVIPQHQFADLASCKRVASAVYKTRGGKIHNKTTCVAVYVPNATQKQNKYSYNY